jgi:hypothetical protein
MLTARDLDVPYPSMDHFPLLVLITGLAGHAPAMNQPSAATMTTQRFEEKDRNVNWRKTVALYSKTIGKNLNASLTGAFTLL